MQHLHIVSFDIPYPANYGGVIVIFNQIKALHALGVKVILHCFQYGEREPAAELAEFCHEIYYYKRSRSMWYQLSLTPFIMRSRESSALMKRLRRDNYPILFEGMHTAGMVLSKKLRNRHKIVRMHNIEWQYYESLSQLTDPLDFWKKTYFFVESLKLQRIEPDILLHADDILTVSENDFRYFKAQKSATHYLPVFHPNEHIESQPGRGEFVLFHGKLSIEDNERAALWLISEVFAKLDVPFVIAGLDPSQKLKDAVSRHSHISLIENPDDRHMHQLIRDAHINLLVSFQVAGMKLKLVNALFRGRLCVVNDNMVSGTGLEKLCLIRNSAAAIRQTIEAHMNAPFSQSSIDARREILLTKYSNLENAKNLMQIIRW